MAGNRIDSVVGVQEGCIFRDAEIQISLTEVIQRVRGRELLLLLSASAEWLGRGIWREASNAW